MPLFFILAGYLHRKPQYAMLKQLKKYWKTLIVPYLLFQVMFYPYLLVQQSIQKGIVLNDFSQFVIMPFVRCFWGIPIDGPTWFIFALLITKIIADVVFRSRFSVYLVIFLCSLSIIGAYFIWMDDKLNITFAIDSLFNFFPFFFVGYYLKAYDILKNEKRSKCLVKIGVYFSISTLLLLADIDNYIFQRIFFYVLGLFGSLFIINICKVLTKCPDFIQTISIGSIIILGLHWMFIGTTNFLIEYFFNLEEGILYSVLEAVLLVLAITSINYIIIKFCQRHFKVLLGYR